MNQEIIIQVVGITAGILTACSQLPQVIKMLREKKSEDVSLFMLLILLGGIAFWIVYGILKKDAPIIATNSFSFLTNIFLIILRIKFRK